MRFASLGSGSKGNATVISNDNASLLVDCGFTYRETCLRLERLGLDASDISAILVTHEHSDHAAGVGVFARKQNIPVYLTRGTARHRLFDRIPELEFISAEHEFAVSGFDVLPVSVPHDAREPVQYIIRSQHYSLGVLTDLGCITPHIIEQFAQCQSLLLECNHDRQMLMAGPYPESLKARVASDWGHLSNEQAAILLHALDPHVTRKLVLAHLSEQNNSPGKVIEMLDQQRLQQQFDIEIACQNQGFDWLRV